LENLKSHIVALIRNTSVIQPLAFRFIVSQPFSQNGIHFYFINVAIYRRKGSFEPDYHPEGNSKNMIGILHTSGHISRDLRFVHHHPCRRVYTRRHFRLSDLYDVLCEFHDSFLSLLRMKITVSYWFQF